MFQEITFSVSAKSCHERAPFYPLTLTQHSLFLRSPTSIAKQIPTLNKFNDIHSLHCSVPQKYAHSCPTYFTHSLILFQIIHSSLAIDAAKSAYAHEKSQPMRTLDPVHRDIEVRAWGSELLISCRHPCSLQRSWMRWPLKVPSDSIHLMIQ